MKPVLVSTAIDRDPDQVYAFPMVEDTSATADGTEWSLK